MYQRKKKESEMSTQDLLQRQLEQQLLEQQRRQSGSAATTATTTTTSSTKPGQGLSTASLPAPRAAVPQPASAPSQAGRGVPTVPQPAGRGGAAPQSNQAWPEASVNILTNLGFSRNESIEALTVCQGNVDAAASYLFSRSGNLGF